MTLESFGECATIRRELKNGPLEASFHHSVTMICPLRHSIFSKMACASFLLLLFLNTPVVTSYQCSEWRGLYDVHAQCTELKIMGGSLDNDEASKLASALMHSTVSQVELNFCGLGAVGAEVIALALPHSKVTWLSSNGNPIGDAGIAALASAVALEVLEVYDAGLTSDGAVALGNALRLNSKLTQLVLYGNLIGDAGAVSLASSIEVIHKSTLINSPRPPYS